MLEAAILAYDDKARGLPGPSSAKLSALAHESYVVDLTGLPRPTLKALFLRSVLHGPMWLTAAILRECPVDPCLKNGCAFLYADRASDSDMFLVLVRGLRRFALASPRVRDTFDRIAATSMNRTVLQYLICEHLVDPLVYANNHLVAARACLLSAVVPSLVSYRDAFVRCAHSPCIHPNRVVDDYHVQTLQWLRLKAGDSLVAGDWHLALQGARNALVIQWLLREHEDYPSKVIEDLVLDCLLDLMHDSALVAATHPGFQLTDSVLKALLRPEHGYCLLGMVKRAKALRLSLESRQALLRALPAVMHVATLRTLQKVHAVLGGADVDYLFVLRAIHDPKHIVDCLNWLRDDVGCPPPQLSSTITPCLQELARHHTLPAVVWFLGILPADMLFEPADAQAVLRDCLFSDVETELRRYMHAEAEAAPEPEKDRRDPLRGDEDEDENEDGDRDDTGILEEMRGRMLAGTLVTARTERRARMMGLGRGLGRGAGMGAGWGREESEGDDDYFGDDGAGMGGAGMMGTEITGAESEEDDDFRRDRSHRVSSSGSSSSSSSRSHPVLPFVQDDTFDEHDHLSFIQSIKSLVKDGEHAQIYLIEWTMVNNFAIDLLLHKRRQAERFTPSFSDTMRWLLSTAPAGIFNRRSLEKTFCTVSALRDPESADALVALVRHPAFVLSPRICSGVQHMPLPLLVAVLANAHTWEGGADQWHRALCESALKHADVDDLQEIMGGTLTTCCPLTMARVLAWFQRDDCILDCLSHVNRLGMGPARTSQVQSCVREIAARHTHQVLHWFWPRFGDPSLISNILPYDLLPRCVDVGNIAYFCDLVEVNHLTWPDFYSVVPTIRELWRDGRCRKFNVWYLTVTHPRFHAYRDTVFFKEVLGWQGRHGDMDLGIAHFVREFLETSPRLLEDVKCLTADLQVNHLLMGLARPAQVNAWAECLVHNPEDISESQAAFLLARDSRLSTECRDMLLRTVIHGRHEEEQVLLVDEILSRYTQKSSFRGGLFHLTAPLYACCCRHKMTIDYYMRYFNRAPIPLLLLLLDETGPQARDFVAENIGSMLMGSLEQVHNVHSPFALIMNFHVLARFCDDPRLYADEHNLGSTVDQILHIPFCTDAGWWSCAFYVQVLARVFESPFMTARVADTLLTRIGGTSFPRVYGGEGVPQDFRSMVVEDDEDLSAVLKTLWVPRPRHGDVLNAYTKRQVLDHLISVLVAKLRWQPRSVWTELVTRVNRPPSAVATVTRTDDTTDDTPEVDAAMTTFGERMFGLPLRVTTITRRRFWEDDDYGFHGDHVDHDHHDREDGDGDEDEDGEDDSDRSVYVRDEDDAGESSDGDGNGDGESMRSDYDSDRSAIVRNWDDARESSDGDGDEVEDGEDDSDRSAYVRDEVRSEDGAEESGDDEDDDGDASYRSEGEDLWDDDEDVGV